MGGCRQRSLSYGATDRWPVTMTSPWKPDPNQVTSEVTTHIEEEEIAARYPILAEVSKTNLHSTGVSYYVLLGDELGYIPLSEWTIHDSVYQQAQGETPNGQRAKIADGAWLSPETNEEVVAIEFQKWTSQEKIHEKTRHLVEFSEMVESIDLVILHYWDTVGHRNELEQVKDYLSGEYTYNGEPYELRADALVIESVFNTEGAAHSHAYTELRQMIPTS